MKFVIVFNDKKESLTIFSYEQSLFSISYECLHHPHIIRRYHQLVVTFKAFPLPRIPGEGIQVSVCLFDMMKVWKKVENLITLIFYLLLSFSRTTYAKVENEDEEALKN